MSSSTTILRTVTAATAIFATLSLGAAHANGNTWGGSSSSSSTSNLDDEVRHIDEMNRMQQQQNLDAMNATIPGDQRPECRGAAANTASARLGKHADPCGKLAARGAADRGE